MINNQEEQEVCERFQKLKQQINQKEMELEWAESQTPNEYRYITDLEKSIEKLYEELDAID